MHAPLYYPHGRHKESPRGITLPQLYYALVAPGHTCPWHERTGLELTADKANPAYLDNLTDGRGMTSPMDIYRPLSNSHQHEIDKGSSACAPKRQPDIRTPLKPGPDRPRHAAPRLSSLSLLQHRSAVMPCRFLRPWMHGGGYSPPRSRLPDVGEAGSACSPY